MVIVSWQHSFNFSLEASKQE